MRLLVLVAAVAVAVASLGALTIAGAVAAEDKKTTEKKYSDAYDDLDVDAILKDDAERDRYYGCFMDTGPCHNAVARFFKSKAPEAIVTACKYCTRRQQQMFDKIVSWYVEKRPQDWHVLIEKTIRDARQRGL